MTITSQEIKHASSSECTLMKTYGLTFSDLSKCTKQNLICDQLLGDVNKEN